MKMANKPVESKREDYRKYLERSGVMDTLTKILTRLYEENEKPTDALGYCYKLMTDDHPDQIEHDDVVKELEEQKTKVAALEQRLAEANARIAALEKKTSATESTTDQSGVQELRPIEVPEINDVVD